MNGAEFIALGRLDQRLNHRLFSDIKILMETKGHDLYRVKIRGVSASSDHHFIATWYAVEGTCREEKEREIHYHHGFSDISELVEYLINIDNKLASSEHVSENIFKEE